MFTRKPQQSGAVSGLAAAFGGAPPTQQPAPQPAPAPSYNPYAPPIVETFQPKPAAVAPVTPPVTPPEAAAFGGIMSMLAEDTDSRSLDKATAKQIFTEVAFLIGQKYAGDQLRHPSDEIRMEVRGRVGELVARALQSRQLTARVPHEQEIALADDIAQRLVGLGFLEMLLPPKRVDLAEIVIDPYGTVWVKRKGDRTFTAVEMDLEPVEVDTVFSNLLGQQLKAASEANPTINAKLPRTPANPGGGRIKFIHPVIAPGSGFPSVNIRLFEPEPVKPERMLQWAMLDEPTLSLMARLVRSGQRGFVVGGTSTGKTTQLSMLCNFLPLDYRILTIEDPQEIWISNPHVITLEARPSSASSELKPYLLADGVDDAMRMTPDYLVVGEVREGRAAQSLFRAMMSDHAGMSTFHADSPDATVQRISLLLEADTNTSARAAKLFFSAAINWLMQIGYDPRTHKRKVLGVYEVNEELRDGEVTFNPLVLYRGNDVWEPVGQPQRVRAGHGAIDDLPPTWREILALDDQLRETYAPVIERRRAAFKAKGVQG